MVRKVAGHCVYLAICGAMNLQAFAQDRDDSQQTLPAALLPALTGATCEDAQPIGVGEHFMSGFDADAGVCLEQPFEHPFFIEGWWEFTASETGYLTVSVDDFSPNWLGLRLYSTCPLNELWEWELCDKCNVRGPGLLMLPGQTYFIHAATDGFGLSLNVQFAPFLPLQIIQNPQPAVRCIGGEVVFAFSVSGFPFPSYNWYKDGVLLPVGSSPMLRLSATQVSDSGSYSCRAENSLGAMHSAVQSEEVELTVLKHCQPHFGTPREWSVGDAPMSITVGKFNQNSSLDVAVANRDSSTVSILIDPGEAQNETSHSVELTVGANPRDISSGAFYPLDGEHPERRDGLVDLAVATDAGVFVLHNLGTGQTAGGTPNFSTVNRGNPCTLSTTAALEQSVLSVNVGDGNGRGAADLAVLSTGSSTVRLACATLGDGSGTGMNQCDEFFGAQPGTDSAQLEHPLLQALEMGPIFSSRPDLVLSPASPNEILVLPNLGSIPEICEGSGLPECPKFLGWGDGDLVSVGTAANPVAVVIADLEHRPSVNVLLKDIATANRDSDSVSVLFNRNSGNTFVVHSVIPVGDAPVALAAMDLEGDGDNDLAIANSGDGTVSILQNNGDGEFISLPPVVVGGTPSAIVAADFNADGAMDFAVADSANDRVLFFLADVCERSADIDCDDGNECTTDSCDADLGCVNEPIVCDDSNECTLDSCNPNSGCVHTDNSAQCVDSFNCTVDYCDAVMGCQHFRDNTFCSDRLYCNGFEVCDPISTASDANGCRPSTRLPCGPGQCDEARDICRTRPSNFPRIRVDGLGVKEK